MYVLRSFLTVLLVHWLLTFKTRHRYTRVAVSQHQTSKSFIIININEILSARLNTFDLIKSQYNVSYENAHDPDSETCLTPNCGSANHFYYGNPVRNSATIRRSLIIRACAARIRTHKGGFNVISSDELHFWIMKMGGGQ